MMAINISLENNRIVVEDAEIEARYTVPADTPAVNSFGNETDITWREAFEQGIIQVVDEDHPAATTGMLGSIYVV